MAAGRLTHLTAPAGPKPVLDASLCLQMNNQATAKAVSMAEGDDVKVVDEILKATSPRHGHVLLTVAPGEVMWWVRTMGSISIESLGVAVHEANHAVDAVLTACNGGAATYKLNGVTSKTEHTRGDTPNYSIMADALPSALKGGFRYRQYVEGNGVQPGSDFSMLLDEFVAYTGAAGMELSIVRSNEYNWLLNREIDAFDGNAGGMVDFMVYVLSYLKALRTHHPDVYLNLQKAPNMLSLLQAVWTTAEKTLTAIYDYTLLANRGGVLVLSREALATLYSDEFLMELDRLGVSHTPTNASGQQGWWTCSRAGQSVPATSVEP